jgi:hypothetical protein
MRSDEEVREVPADVEMGMITAVEGLHPTLKFASDTWQNREAQSKKRIEDHESRERLLTNEIYQLVGFASAFQSLLLTAVAQATQLHCHNVGIPLTLSSFATVVTIAGEYHYPIEEDPLDRS